jgi:D-alanyl-lipoteichoic acid acyltransferase DltB (MBOAT superfamily)
MVAIVALINIVVGSFFASIRRCKALPIIWTISQVFVLCAALDAMYVSIFGALFICCCALFTVLCKQKEEQRLTDSNIVKVEIVDRKFVCATGWAACAMSAILVVHWNKSLAPPRTYMFDLTDISLVSEDNCLLIFLAFLLFTSLVCGLKILETPKDDSTQ